MRRNPEGAKSNERWFKLMTELRRSLNFWQRLEVPIDQDDIIQQLEFIHRKYSEHPLPDEGRKKKMLLYIPPISIAQMAAIYEDRESRLGVVDDFGYSREDILGYQSVTDGTSYLLSHYSSQEPDQLSFEGDPLSPQFWQRDVEERGFDTMGLKERLIVGLWYGMTHLGFMDERHITFCPETKLNDYHCVEVAYGSTEDVSVNNLYISASPLGITNENAGVRMVVRSNCHEQE